MLERAEEEFVMATKRAALLRTRAANARKATKAKLSWADNLERAFRDEAPNAHGQASDRAHWLAARALARVNSKPANSRHDGATTAEVEKDYRAALEYADKMRNKISKVKRDYKLQRLSKHPEAHWNGGKVYSTDDQQKLLRGWWLHTNRRIENGGKEPMTTHEFIAQGHGS